MPAAVAKCGVVENVLTWADFKQSKELKKNDGAKRQRITGIPKLDDANDAGGKSSEKCTLILTEGDSAKALAVSSCPFHPRYHHSRKIPKLIVLSPLLYLHL